MISRRITLNCHEIIYYKDDEINMYGVKIFNILNGKTTEINIRKINNEYILTIITIHQGEEQVKVVKQIQSKKLDKQYDYIKSLVLRMMRLHEHTI